MIQAMEDENDEEIADVTRSKIEPYLEKVNEALSAFDEGKLSKHVKRSMLDMTVGYTIKGIREKAYSKGEFDAEKYLSELKEYFEMMKNTVYVDGE